MKASLWARDDPVSYYSKGSLHVCFTRANTLLEGEKEGLGLQGQNALPLQVELPQNSVKSTVAAFEKQHPVLQSISKPTWIRATRQRSTTDAVLSWLNATRRPASSNPAASENAMGKEMQAQVFPLESHLSWNAIYSPSSFFYLI